MIHRGCACEERRVLCFVSFRTSVKVIDEPRRRKDEAFIPFSTGRLATSRILPSSANTSGAAGNFNLSGLELADNSTYGHYGITSGLPLNGV
jgi:hypothetical protein